jgi:hypothetical protein
VTAEEWADAIYEATGWTVGANLAQAIGGMIETQAHLARQERKAMLNKEVTTDFADGFRSGFEAARVQLEAAVTHALGEYKSVLKAMRAVQSPEPGEDKRELDELRAALLDCSDDLAAEIEARYAGTQDVYPSEKQRFDRDMASVTTARELLAKGAR